MRQFLHHPITGLIILFFIILNPQTLTAQSSDTWAIGHWQGILKAGSQELQILYHIEAADDGGLSGTMDVPAQGATGIPLSSVSVTGQTLSMTFPLPGGGSYEGMLNDAGAEIEGTFSQGPQSIPLNLAKADANAGPPPKPQEPQPPFPYEAEEVTFSNPTANLELSGTLTKPQGDGPFPGVVLVSGAGPHDRDGSMLGHKPFLVIADHLTRHGIAVLRFDDRGTAKSSGDFGSAMPNDLAGDALAAVAFLTEHPAIDDNRVGLAGHSEGGQVALLAASQSPQVAYLVLLAGSALPAKDLLAPQAQMINAATGIPAQAITPILDRITEIVIEEPDPEAAAPRLQQAAQAEIGQLDPALQNDMVKQVVSQIIQQFNTPQTRFTLQHDPRPLLEQLTIPVLALFGGKDGLAPPALNAPAMEAALEQTDATVQTLPGLNHLFQEAQTGAPTEYGQIEQTFAPAALALIETWISERFRADSSRD